MTFAYSPRLQRSATTVAVVFVGLIGFAGGWHRRWISDDGLIVLRTVRNLVAGNGPVFNVGERVEANTSTLWQYLIYAGQRLTGARLEIIALVLALLLSVCALMIGTWATAGIYRSPELHSARIRPVGPHIAFPAGALVYVALPPARDFMTSGLEWGLSTFYLAMLWALLVLWATKVSTPRTLLLAFWAGLSWLVRPELALYGAVVGLLLLITSKPRWAVLAVALPLPAGYQIFRMGYYGLLTPHTAVAKSATDAAWAKGFSYTWDLVGSYWMFIPILLLLVAGALALRNYVRRSFITVSAVMLFCALFHTLYVIRVGGDFMHGRMLLLPLFAALLPVFVLPVTLTRQGLKSLALTAGVGLWSLAVVLHGHQTDWDTYSGKINIVDERDFWTYATKRQPGHPPLYTEDFQQAKFLNGFVGVIPKLLDGDALAVRYLVDPKEQEFSWRSVGRDPQRQDPPTLYFINMGMSSMNSPLSVRVLDNIGLATPLAARQPRLAGARIGHDKLLSREWQTADTAADVNELPAWIDAEEVELCRQALATKDFQELFATYRDPLTVGRFFSNIKWSLGKGRTLKLSEDPRVYLDK